MFLAYKRACDGGKVVVGSMPPWKNPGGGWVINFPTKEHWRQPSQLGWVVGGLEDLARVLRDQGIRSVAIPALGCGLGGLLWYHSFLHQRTEVYGVPDVGVRDSEVSGDHLRKSEQLGVRGWTEKG